MPFLLIVAAALGSARVRAETGSNSGETGAWTLSPTLVSQYLFRGVRIAGASFQPAIEYSNEHTVLGVWCSAALRDRQSGDRDREIDLYGSYTFSAGEKLKIVPGIYLYTYPESKRSSGFYRATVEPSVAAVFSAWGVQFTPKVYYDLMLDGPTAEVSAAMAWPLTGLGTEVDFVASAGIFHSRDFAAGLDPHVKNGGGYWLVGISVPIQVGMRSRVITGFTYSEGRSNYFKQGRLARERNEAAGRHGAFSLTYAIAF